MALAMLLAGGCFSGSACADEAMPQVLRVGSQSEAVPAWVDASRVLRSSGEINTDLFHDHSAQAIARLLQQRASNGCINMGAPIRDMASIHDETGASLIPSRETLDDAYRTSELVFMGTVTGRAYGFSEYVPGQLLRLAPITTFKDKEAAQRQYFVFMPVGTFKIGDKTICKFDPAYADPPEIGDRVVILLQRGFREDFQYLSVPDATGIIILKKNGAAGLPAQFRSEALGGLSADKLITHLEGLAREGGK